MSSVEAYVEHQGTIRISGSTIPRSAAACALHFLERGIDPVDIFYIGGNAGQQATKTMGIIRFLVSRSKALPYDVAFEPNLFKALIHERDDSDSMKAVSVWRIVKMAKREIAAPQ